mmetsp:Transcript_28655/g.92105  ORF Transcript_28655/g.92105 Transcript_28655/m.92105 type:complete len:318 (+) Transcript_28655:142-1095(+)
MPVAGYDDGSQFAAAQQPIRGMGRHAAVVVACACGAARLHHHPGTIFEAEEEARIREHGDRAVLLVLDQGVGIQFQSGLDLIQDFRLHIQGVAPGLGLSPLDLQGLVGNAVSLDDLHLLGEFRLDDVCSRADLSSDLLELLRCDVLSHHLSFDDLLIVVGWQLDIHELEAPTIGIRPLQSVRESALHGLADLGPPLPELRAFILGRNLDESVPHLTDEEVLIVMAELLVQLTDLVWVQLVLNRHLQVQGQALLCPRVKRFEACAQLLQQHLVRELHALDGRREQQEAIPRTQKVAASLVGLVGLHPLVVLVAPNAVV